MCRQLLLALCCFAAVQSLTLNKADGNAKPVWAADLVKARVETDKVQGLLAEPERGIRPGFLRYPTTPTGWEVKTDAASGRTFFYNPETRVTTFRRPNMDGTEYGDEMHKTLHKNLERLRTKKEEGKLGWGEAKALAQAEQDEETRKGEMGAFYLWAEKEESYVGDHEKPGESIFLDNNPSARDSPIFKGFKGLNYNEVPFVDHGKYVGEAENWGIVPTDKNAQYPAVPYDHSQKAVSIFFSYVKLLEHISTLDPKGTYMIIENDQFIVGDWEDKLRHVHEEHPGDADAIGLVNGGNWNGPSGWNLPIGCWAVPGADAAKRILKAVHETKLNCWDFDGVLRQLSDEGKIKWMQAPYPVNGR